MTRRLGASGEVEVEERGQRPHVQQRPRPKGPRTVMETPWMAESERQGS